jgi:DHA2 family multidrug resistance protein
MADGIAQPWTPKANPWLIAVVVALAAFMEILDTSIANVALPYIAGNVGASGDESTWVLTSYLVSNAIVLPLSGWIAGRFGRKRFFMACIVLFTISSVLCGFAPSLMLLIVFRIVQGAGGGGLQPMAQAILADTFPMEKRGLAFAVFGITAVVAPAIGPTLGGWITDNYSWRWIFFINVPVGAGALFLISRLVEDPPYLAATRNAGVRLDYVGIALLVLGVGALQVLLDKGQEDDWFGSSFIVVLALIAAVCLIGLVVWEWFRQDPVIDVRLFRNVNFFIANLMMFMVGAVLFASVVLLPQLLQSLMGYSAESAGLALSAGGLVLMVTMPIAGQISARIAARYVVAFGWLLLAIGMYYTVGHLNLQISLREVQWLRIVQAFSLPFIFVPLSLIAYVGIAPEKSNSVSGMLNFMRNMGSSVGTSMVTALVAQRAQLHQVTLSAHATMFNPSFRDAVAGLAHRIAPAGPASAGRAHAYAMLYRTIVGQATTLAYLDTFATLSVAAVLMFALTFALKKNPIGAGARVAVE